MGECPDRRRFLTAMLSAVAAGTAGCESFGGPEASETYTTVTPASVPKRTTEPERTELPVLVPGAEADNLAEVERTFEQRNPEIDLELEPVFTEPNSVDYEAILRRQFKRDEQPPSTWLSTGGATLDSLAADGYLRSIDESVWEPAGLEAAVPAGVQRLARPIGETVAVPVSIQQVGLLYYNTSVLTAAGVDPATLTEPKALLTALEAVAAETDAIPLAYATRGGLTTLQLFETVLVGRHGPAAHASLIDEPATAESTVTDALSLVAEYAEFRSSSADAVTWRDAVDWLLEGEAAVLQMGDWVTSAHDQQVGESIDFRPFPGTGQQTIVTGDVFPRTATNRLESETKAFLRYVGGVEAQTSFCTRQGSTPARTDVDANAFTESRRRHLRQYATADSHRPSIAHGQAVPPETTEALVAVCDAFTDDWDVQTAADEIVASLS